jgi:hypothetical protein
MNVGLHDWSPYVRKADKLLALLNVIAARIRDRGQRKGAKRPGQQA